MPATEPPVVLPEAALALPGTPTIKRRLAVMVYEFFLLFAVEMLAVLLYLLVTGNRQDPLFQHGLKVYLFVITGLYFTWCWRDSGHTLAMKTWRIKLVKVGHARVPFGAALLRHLLAWCWLLPALYLSHALQLGHGQTGIALALGIVLWSLTAFLDKDRQFLHDRLAGTRLIELPKNDKRVAATA